MHDVHGIAALPDSDPPGESDLRANEAVPAFFAAYERDHEIPVVRPVRVDRVTDAGGLLVVHAGDRTWTTRTLVNATGTWRHPFVPHYPGVETFRGEQLHTVDYPGAGALPRTTRRSSWAVARPRCSSWASSRRSPTPCGSPVASRSGAPTTSPRTAAARRSRWSRSGSGRAFRPRAS